MPEAPPARAPTSNRRRLGQVALLGTAAAIALALVISNVARPAAASCAPQLEAAKAIDAAATGQLAALSGTGAGRGYADMTFTDASGKPLTIADFAGKKLLVNFWASWCVPCREEMPALDALAARHNSEGFQVLPVNLDIGAAGLEKARAFLETGKWAHLPLYADTTFAAFDRLKTEGVTLGLPASLLLDEKGCELAVLQGPAEWDSPAGDTVVATLLGL